MPSFDIISEVSWQAMDDAINQTLKEILNRFDFKGVKVEIEMDEKAKTVKISTSEAYKIEAIKETFHKRLMKRGISLLSLDYQPEEKASGAGARVIAKVAAGIEKEKGKEIIAILKQESKKVQAQIQDEKLRVSSKSRDDLQAAIAVLKDKEAKIGLPLQFNNFRE
jgi:cyclic-di-GMP-binding protein